MIGHCLKLYAPAIVLVIYAALVPFVSNAPALVVLRLLILAAALAVSIGENRRSRRGHGL